MTVPFEKYDGAGNDFVVVDAEGESVEDRAAFARLHCDREVGVRDEGSAASRGGEDEGSAASGGGEDAATSRHGADGVLFLSLDADADPARVAMTLVQPDGSIAEMCGNGARCVAAWAADRSDAATFQIDTPAGTRRAVVEGDEVAVEMGEATFDPDQVPLAGDDPLVDAALPELDGTPAADLAITAVNTGVPHAVVFVDGVDAVDIDTVAPSIRHGEAFPEGANVTFATSAADGGFRQRTYERGVEGETRACGTGAVAIAVVAKRLGRLPQGTEDGQWVSVTPPGGELAVAVPGDGPARLRGPAERQFSGELAVPLGDRIAGVTGEAALGVDRFDAEEGSNEGER
jgi:diaminopimelate epimerase